MQNSKTLLFLIMFVFLSISSGVMINLLSNLIENPILDLLGNYDWIAIIVGAILSSALIPIISRKIDSQSAQKIPRDQIIAKFSRVWLPLEQGLHEELTAENTRITFLLREIDSEYPSGLADLTSRSGLVIHYEDLHTITAFDNDLGKKISKYIQSKDLVNATIAQIIVASKRHRGKIRSIFLRSKLRRQITNHKYTIQSLESVLQRHNPIVGKG